MRKCGSCLLPHMMVFLSGRFQISLRRGKMLWLVVLLPCFHPVTLFIMKNITFVIGISLKFRFLYSLLCFSAFYTSKYGYKMCLRIYLNGDGTGRGTHLSLFFVVMRGHSDALLKWPFNQKVTLSLNVCCWDVLQVKCVFPPK